MTRPGKTQLILSVDDDVKRLIEEWSKAWGVTVGEVIDTLARFHNQQLAKTERQIDGTDET